MAYDLHRWIASVISYLAMTMKDQWYWGIKYDKNFESRTGNVSIYTNPVGLSKAQKCSLQLKSEENNL
ncbi:MAG: hypothetical protein COV59_04055 [Candidatus Magasanikbacteria bacterium CG11_big_fil_rev_8_21_14_0_20_39_34]|uniref:Uncharacterized protein n=1 Tax=Candidatus Magasanikbacteria bacterium CG11_big_fil_rev_8_21_14_0_20_39_34 TaxID=1974653 RepID=A0A2H0N6S1_9BACT|nr:MAG: hypothetical protein COV59_04055 [Candidatus Magasanikbacteria bacterium CG11_big_fil_rev_8_21_14_0_20_39_34]